MPGLPVHHQLWEFTQTHVHRVGDAIQPYYIQSKKKKKNPGNKYNKILTLSSKFMGSFYFLFEILIFFPILQKRNLQNVQEFKKKIKLLH